MFKKLILPAVLLISCPVIPLTSRAETTFVHLDSAVKEIRGLIGNGYNGVEGCSVKTGQNAVQPGPSFEIYLKAKYGSVYLSPKYSLYSKTVRRSYTTANSTDGSIVDYCYDNHWDGNVFEGCGIHIRKFRRTGTVLVHLQASGSSGYSCESFPIDK